MKKSNQDETVEAPVEKSIPKGKIRLYRLDAIGGYADFDANHAERILALESKMDARTYERRD